MNWAYLRAAALEPLVIALGVTFLAGIVTALLLHRGGGSSRVALRRFLRVVGLTFPAAFLVAGVWEGRATVLGAFRAGLGRPADQRSMGILRSYGEGFLAKDASKARAWYLKAANQGDAEARLLLAQAFLQGGGVPADPAAALHWAQLAAEQGEPYAMLLTGDLLAERDPRASSAYYTRALSTARQKALGGDPDAAFLCGQILRAGKPLPLNAVESLAWLLFAEQLGLPPSRLMAVRLATQGLPPAGQVMARARLQALQREAREASAAQTAPIQPSR